MTAPSPDAAGIGDRLDAVRERLAAACRRAGRDPGEVTLVAVSKAHPADAVRAAWERGQRVFGENYVQELVAKAAELADDAPNLRWRFIGHLQRNKAKDVVRVGAAVDSVDGMRLAQALARRVPDGAPPLEVLVEVNVGREPQKAGCLPEELPALLAELRELSALRCRGLMTIPPAADDPEDSRSHFRALAELARSAPGDGEPPLPELSMGMSGDFEVAVEEGATLVRVGTAIFGPRPPR